VKFEYDENKSCINKEKHNIDFVEAQKLWQDENALIVPAQIVDEETRYALISKILTKCFVAIFTIRNGAYRIISVRRCRKNITKTQMAKKMGTSRSSLNRLLDPFNNSVSLATIESAVMALGKRLEVQIV